MTTTTAAQMCFREHYADDGCTVTRTELVNPEHTTTWSAEIVGFMRLQGRTRLGRIEEHDGVEYVHITVDNGSWVWRLTFDTERNVYVGRWPD